MILQFHKALSTGNRYFQVIFLKSSEIKHILLWANKWKD